MKPEPPEASEVARRLDAQQLTVSAGEAAQLAAFVGLLEHWNRVHNLTGIRDRGELIERHLVESLALAPLLAGPRIADIGSGGGLPGLPLAIVRPGMAFTLIESRRKRVSFLRHAAATLPLANVAVAHGRAEALELGTFNTVLARAVAPPAELLALATPLVLPGGRLVLLTGAAKGLEITALAEAAGYRRLGTEATALKSVIVALERPLS